MIGKLVAGASVAAAGYGYVRNVDKDRQVTNAFYETMLGSPDFDTYATGRQLTMNAMFNPLGQLGTKIGNVTPPLLRAAMQGGLSPQAYSDARRQKSYSRHSPLVDGSTVLGMYNSRLG